MDSSRRARVSPWLLETLYVYGFAFIVLAHHVCLTTWGLAIRDSHPLFFPLMRAAAAMPVAAKLILEQHTRRENIMAVVLVAFGYLIGFVTGEYNPFFNVLLVIGARDVRLKRLAKVLIASLALCMAVTFYLHAIGKSAGLVGKRRDSGKLRPSFGFTNPNWTSYTCFEIVMMCAVLCWRRRPLLHLVIASSALLFVYGIEDSRTAAIGIGLAVIVVQADAFAWRHRLSRNKALTTLVAVGCLLTVVGSIAVSYYLMLRYDPNNALQAKINYALSERLRLLSELFATYPPTLLGQNFAKLPRITYSNGWNHYVYADNAYVRYLINFGYVYTVIFFASLITLYVRAVRNRRTPDAMLILMVYVIYGLMEAIPLYVIADPLLVSMRALYYGEPLDTLNLDDLHEITPDLEHAQPLPQSSVAAKTEPVPLVGKAAANSSGRPKGKHFKVEG